MRKFFLLALTAGAVGVASMGAIGCGDGGSGGSGGGNGGSGADGGNGGAGGAGGATTGGTTTTTGATTASQSCEGLLPNPNNCGTCIMEKCCAPLQACFADDECADCVVNPDADPGVCNSKAQLAEINQCGASQCALTCSDGACDAPATSPSGGSCVTIGGLVECNPITNEPCGAGEACDRALGGFICYADGNVHTICEQCGSSSPDKQYCQGGLACVGICSRYCCEDTDCGSSGKCTKGMFDVPAVGFCEGL